MSIPGHIVAATFRSPTGFAHLHADAFSLKDAFGQTGNLKPLLLAAAIPLSVHGEGDRGGEVVPIDEAPLTSPPRESRVWPGCSVPPIGAADGGLKASFTGPALK